MTELFFTPEQFSPAAVFESGQTFRFRKTQDGAYEGMAHGVHVCAKRSGDRVVFRAEGDHPQSVWEKYTDADRDYSALFRRADPVLQAALDHGRGLRVLRQEPFETLISFIISANNNIPRISGIIERLCGACAEGCGTDVPFPGPERILDLSENDLRAIGAGYRAPYILESARRASDMDWDELAEKPWEDLRKELLKFAGVGPKVADCIALFALGRTDAFPVDVWIRRVLRELYGVDGTPEQVRRSAAALFGEHAGIAQQYLFHYARSVLPRGAEAGKARGQRGM